MLMYYCMYIRELENRTNVCRITIGGRTYPTSSKHALKTLSANTVAKLSMNPSPEKKLDIFTYTLLFQGCRHF